ncbi:hypothetical protein E4T56_gene5363 [Termitomyces sp. T112]|nr:hypothetical protein E4T56_gene5363 [Termitomyces sp. T112]
MVFCLNPAKPVPFPCNPTPLDLPRSVQITSHQLSAQAISAQNAFECSVASARGSRPPSKDSPSAAEPPRCHDPSPGSPHIVQQPPDSPITPDAPPNCRPCPAPILVSPDATPANSDASPANSDGPLANFNAFPAATDTYPGSPEP